MQRMRTYLLFALLICLVLICLYFLDIVSLPSRYHQKHQLGHLPLWTRSAKANLTTIGKTIADFEANDRYPSSVGDFVLGPTVFSSNKFGCDISEHIIILDYYAIIKRNSGIIAVSKCDESCSYYLVLLRNGEIEVRRCELKHNMIPK